MTYLENKHGNIWQYNNKKQVIAKWKTCNQYDIKSLRNFLEAYESDFQGKILGTALHHGVCIPLKGVRNEW